MPSSPYAKALVSVNGAGNTSGGVDVASAATLQFSGESTVGWRQQRWEIYEYPEGFATPGSWTLGADGTIYSTSVTPALVTLPANTALWGPWAVRLKINEAIDDNATVVPNLTDETTICNMLSPLGQRMLAALEGVQFCTATTLQKAWVRSLQRNGITIEALLAGTGATSPNPKPQSLLADFTCTTSASGGSTNLSLPVAINEIWIINFGGSIGCSSIGGVKLALICPTGATVEGGVMGAGVTDGTHFDAARFADGATYVAALTAQATVFPVLGTARVKIDSSHSGAIVFSARPVTNTQTATVKAGFWMSARKVTEV